MTQLIELNMEYFGVGQPINFDSFPSERNRIKFYPGAKMQDSYRYKQPRPTDKLISFIDYEYKKISSDLIKRIIIENRTRPKRVKISNNQIEIILNDQINITV